jgi:hypothetical protein
MSEMEDRQLDALLSEHFAAELDGHVGRCAAAFEHRAAPQRRHHPGGWAMALAAGVAAAACVAVVWNYRHQPKQGPQMANPLSQPSPGQLADAQQTQAPFMERALALQNVDEGTFVMQDVPVRQVRQVLLENVRWYDPREKTEVQLTIPRERLIFIEMETY